MCVSAHYLAYDRCEKMPYWENIKTAVIRKQKERYAAAQNKQMDTHQPQIWRLVPTVLLKWLEYLEHTVPLSQGQIQVFSEMGDQLLSVMMRMRRERWSSLFYSLIFQNSKNSRNRQNQLDFFYDLRVIFWLYIQKLREGVRTSGPPPPPRLDLTLCTTCSL